MNEKMFYNLFDLESFNGHELKFDHTYYAGRKWHSNVVFYLDGVKMDIEGYYSQAYMPFDKRNDEILTISIKNENGVSFGRRVGESSKLRFQEFCDLLNKNLTIEGLKVGDMLYDTIRKEKCKIVAILSNPLRLRLDYVNRPLPLMMDIPSSVFYLNDKVYIKED